MIQDDNRNENEPGMDHDEKRLHEWAEELFKDAGSALTGAKPEEITKDGIPYRIDAERSTLTNEAKDNDAILYLDRLDAESAE